MGGLRGVGLEKERSGSDVVLRFEERVARECFGSCVVRGLVKGRSSLQKDKTRKDGRERRER